ncbi:LytTR family transcriptional regulator DNA-binding domain-containing protein [Paenibacillus sp. ACRRX]|uniref:LytTR family DNA-binding domain-containing protein n=1 Tax=Paenibacillus sp. ACRRX TaxID=2918206 RepID=UPI001EF670E9|nr:LytTR family DNA-binding domain-containing protein [Paenibacillus sp. ACRRX]MCG7408266.1 LytTR family transcriptional regulator DNA-binding domain-containing protein [Paenibacillus sp. ACRRX]
MKVHIDLNDDYEETTVTIHAKAWSEELAVLMNKLQTPVSKRLMGIEEERSILLDPADIDYIFAESRKVFASVEQRKIELKMKLYEVEELLTPLQFMRFSKSVIGNIDLIDRFELAFNGNLCVYFKSGSKEYVSRSYVNALKQQLILGGGKNDS